VPANSADSSAISPAAYPCRHACLLRRRMTAGSGLFPRYVLLTPSTAHGSGTRSNSSGRSFRAGAGQRDRARDGRDVQQAQGQVGWASASRARSGGEQGLVDDDRCRATTVAPAAPAASNR